jgi:allantoinase
MKTGDDPFAMWGGIAGVQSTLPILLNHDPRLPLPQVAALTAGGVARRYGLTTKGRIARGFDADFAIVDIESIVEVQRDMLLDRHRLSPYVGRRFRGAVKRTIVRGHTVFQDGKSVGNFRGRLIKPAPRGGDHA